MIVNKIYRLKYGMYLFLYINIMFYSFLHILSVYFETECLNQKHKGNINYVFCMFYWWLWHWYYIITMLLLYDHNKISRWKLSISHFIHYLCPFLGSKSHIWTQMYKICTKTQLMLTFYLVTIFKIHIYNNWTK